MMGYWKNPEQTQRALRNGWYYTGDMGYLDEKGYLFMLDRKADMIVTGGENVYPKEMKDVLYKHPAVSMAAVVSAPDEKWGERVQAVVVLKPDHTVTEKELMDFCRKSLGGYKCPKSIAFWETIPTTPIGKILRKDVKKTFWEGHDRSIGLKMDVTRPDQIETVVSKIIKELGNVDILVNNAGVMDNMAALHHQTLKMFERDLNVNLSGAFNCIKAVWPAMKKKIGTHR